MPVRRAMGGAMDKSVTESLAQFCIAQRNAFDPDAWCVGGANDRVALALAAYYLSMTSWYGYAEELERIAAATHTLTERNLDLFRVSQTIGFDLLHFSFAVRTGIVRARSKQEHSLPRMNLAA